MLGSIEKLNDTLAAHDLLKRRDRAHLATLAQQRDIFGRHAASRGRTAALAVKGPKDSHGAVAQADRLLQHRVEYRGEVARRAVDDSEHLGGSGLLLKRSADLAV